MLQWITRPGWPGHLLACGAGALTTLALAPFDLWPLAVLSIALFYFGLRHLRPGQAAVRGWSYGFGLFAAGTSWVYVSIHDYGAASPALAGLLTLGFVAGLGLFFALMAALWARWIRRSEAPLADALAFAALIWIIATKIWPPLMNAIEERQQKIAEGLAAADNASRNLAQADAKVAEELKAARAKADAYAAAANLRVARVLSIRDGGQGGYMPPMAEVDARMVAPPPVVEQAAAPPVLAGTNIGIVTVRVDFALTAK